MQSLLCVCVFVVLRFFGLSLRLKSSVKRSNKHTHTEATSTPSDKKEKQKWQQSQRLSFGGKFDIIRFDGASRLFIMKLRIHYLFKTCCKIFISIK